MSEKPKKKYLILMRFAAATMATTGHDMSPIRIVNQKFEESLRNVRDAYPYRIFYSHDWKAVVYVVESSLDAMMLKDLLSQPDTRQAFRKNGPIKNGYRIHHDDALLIVELGRECDGHNTAEALAFLRL